MWLRWSPKSKIYKNCPVPRTCLGPMFLTQELGKEELLFTNPYTDVPKKRPLITSRKAGIRGSWQVFFKGIKYWNVVCLYDRRESHKKNVNQMLTHVTKIMIWNLIACVIQLYGKDIKYYAWKTPYSNHSEAGKKLFIFLYSCFYVSKVF